MRNAENEVARLKKKVCNLIQKGEELDQGLHKDLSAIMHDSTPNMHKAFPEGTFCRVFWDQQLENAKKDDARQFRWHPLIIKWCLNLSSCPVLCINLQCKFF